MIGVTSIDSIVSAPSSESGTGVSVGVGVVIAAGKVSGKVVSALTGVNHAAGSVGSFPVTFTGKAKVQSKEFTVTAPPVPLVVVAPFELKVEPLPVKVKQGGKAKVKVTATRKAGYQGPINVEVRNLPANVAAGKATIAMGQATVEVELAATDTAVVAEKKDVNVLGTATAAANQTNASANFTVNVEKK